MKLPLPARLYFWLVVLAGLATVALWLRAWPEPVPRDPASLGLMAFLGFLSVVAQQFPLKLAPHYKVNAAIAVYFVCLLLFGAAAAVVLVGVCQLIGGALLGLRRHPVPGKRTRSLRSVLFNAAQVVLMTAVGGMVYYGPLPRTAPASLDRVENLWALPAAALTMYLVNSLAVSVMIGLQTRRSLSEVWLAGRRHDALQFAGLFLVALATAASAPQHPWVIPVMALPAAILYLALKRTAQFRAETIAALETLADAVDRRDRYTLDHSRRVANYAVRLARRLHLSAEEIEAVRLAARVHDVGKLAVPDNVLLKPGRFTPHEQALMQEHPRLGWELVSHFPEYRKSGDLILAHHERYDGAGYPDGRSGAGLPLAAQILAVADSLDALTSDRAYRQALPLGQALAELQRQRGTQWHPAVIDALADMLGDQPAPLPARLADAEADSAA